jgi:hypothetical protein
MRRRVSAGGATPSHVATRNYFRRTREMTAQSAEPEIYPGKLELRAPLAASASGPLFKRPNAGADRSAVRRHPRARHTFTGAGTLAGTTVCSHCGTRLEYGTGGNSLRNSHPRNGRTPGGPNKPALLLAVRGRRRWGSVWSPVFRMALAEARALFAHPPCV